MSGPRILFFGRLADVAGGRDLKDQPPEDVRDLAALRTWISTRDPDLGAALSTRGVRVIRNGTFVIGDSGAFARDDEIAFVSPLSGG